MNYKLRMAFRDYCIDNKLFYSGSNEQYEAVMEKVEHCFDHKNAPHTLTSIAGMIWICSVECTKTVLDIEDDLLNLFIQCC